MSQFVSALRSDDSVVMEAKSESKEKLSKSVTTPISRVALMLMY